MMEFETFHLLNFDYEPQAIIVPTHDEVPDDAIYVPAAFLLTQAGAMTMDDLIKQTSRELGFRRTGQKIRSRIELGLNAGLEPESSSDPATALRSRQWMSLMDDDETRFNGKNVGVRPKCRAVTS